MVLSNPSFDRATNNPFDPHTKLSTGDILAKELERLGVMVMSWDSYEHDQVESGYISKPPIWSD